MICHLIDRIKEDIQDIVEVFDYNVDIKNIGLVITPSQTHSLRFYLNSNQINPKGYYHKAGLISFGIIYNAFCRFKDIDLTC